MEAALCPKCKRQLLDDGQCLYCTTAEALDLREIIPVRELSAPPAEKVLTLVEMDSGRSFKLDAPRVRIGREPKCQICLDDVYVSKTHAFITYEDGQFWIEDLGSRNGTKLNGAHIVDREVLNIGDVVTVGRTDLRVE